MTRWTVRKERTMFWDEDDEWRYDHRWHVTSPTGVSWGKYATHAEALDRADKQARTVTVELPRLTALPTGRHVVQKSGLIIEWQDNPDFPKLPPQYLTVKPEERRPLALALLALAEKENA